MWATDPVTLAAWTFSSTSYPANRTNFAATSGTCTGSTFYLDGTGSTWNTGAGKGYAFTAVTSVTITLKLSEALPVGTQITFAADIFYNKASNAPMKGFDMSVSVNEGSFGTTGLTPTSISLTNNSANKSITYTTQSALAKNATIALKYTQTGKAGAGQGFFNNITIVYTPSGSTQPTISTDPVDANYVVGASATALTVEATASAGDLHYKWYSNTTESTEGASIVGTDAASYTPSTTSAGTTYYYCVVTDGNGSATSGFAAVKVSEPTGTFALFSGDLVEGDYVIYYSGKALKNTITSSSRFDYLEVSPENAKLTNPDEAIIWHIAASGDYWTIYNAAVKQYAAGTSSKNQGALVADGTADLALWTASGSSTYDFENKGRAAATSESDKKWLRNNGNYGFACYASTTGGALTLYKKALPKHSVTFNDAPTGGSVAVSVGGSDISSGDQVEEGATVTITPTASTYYQIASVTQGEQAITPVQGVYSFTMPSSDVAIAATFEYIPVTSLTLNKTKLELLVDAEDALSVTAVEPADAYNGVTWDSDYEDVVIVDETGAVLAMGEGTATITATSVVTGTVTATCAVTVTAPSGHEIGITSANGTVVATSDDEVIDIADVLKDVAVVLTATPNDGYSISEWTVVGADYSVSQDKTTCSFTMPDNEVMVEVTYTHEVAVLKLHDANGESTFAGDHFWKEEVTLPTSAAPCSKEFMGWSTDENCNTAPELGATYVLPNKGENHIYAVYASVVSAGVTSYVKTALGEIESGSVVIVTESKTVAAKTTTWAMSNNKGTSAGPAAVEVTDENDEIASPADSILWDIVKDGENFVLYPKGVTNKWLYCTTANDGVRVGTGDNKNFKIDKSYLYNIQTTGRYLGVYADKLDFRCYTSISSNISGQTLAFYKKTVSDPVYGNYSTTCLQKATTPVLTDGGIFDATKTVEMLAEDGATIYYTLDGSDPKTSGTKQTYSAAIELKERGTYTVKAYAVEEGKEASDVAEATYNISLPFTVAEAIALIPKYNDERADTYIDGIVCTAGTSVNEGKMTYFISDNGSAEGGAKVRIYSGKGLDNAAFNDVTDLKIGDKVRVFGKLNNYQGSYDMDNSYLTSLVVASVSSVAIGGEATKTIYSSEDNIFSFAGLTATATYNTGYVKDVTNEDGVWSTNLSENIVTAAGNVNVTAAYGGKTSDATVVAVTYTSKTVASISLSYESVITYVGHALPTKPVVTATYVEDIPEEPVTELASFDDATAYDNSKAGENTITVTYKGKSATYKVVVKDIANDQATAYTAAEINDIIVNAYKSTNESSYDVYVKGIVVADANNSGTYYISADGKSTNQFTIWQGKYFSSSESAKGNVKASDDVIVKGKIQYYNSATPELKSSTVVYQLRAPQFTIANVAEMEVNVTEDIAVADLSVTKDGDGVVTLTESSNTEVVTIAEGKLHAAGAGEATVTANLAATNNSGSINYSAKTTTFTVNVIAERARYSVTFANGGATEGSAPQAIDPQLAESKVYLPENTYSWANHGFNGWAVTKTVSGDAVEIAEDANGKYITMPAAAVTITATWVEIATTKISFMVGGVEKASIDKEQDVAFTIVQDGSAWAPTGFTFVGWATTEQAEETEVAPTTITEYTPQTGVAEVSLYGIYSRVEGEGETNHYVLNYTADVADKDLSYGNAVNVTATDGSEWIVKAYKNKGMQINTDKDASIKIPNCPGKIFSIAITTSTTKSVGLSASDYSGSGNIAYIVSGTAAASQTLDLSGETVTAGYIVPKGGNAIITNIDVEFDASKTYYTSSPVEKVTITFDANGGEGGCQNAIINKGSEFTICENVPTKSHSEFAGWKLNETTTIYQANQNIGEVEEDITLTAQWTNASTYAVTYNMNGSTADAPTEVAQYAGDQFTIAAAIAREGYTFQGWKYGSKLFKAGASFTMPAEAVEFVAQWRKASVPVNKMSMVTSASALSNGMQIALGCSYGENSFAMAGDLGSNKYMASITNGVSLSDGVATYTEDVLIMTLEQVENGWKITKDGANYLTSTGNSNDDLKWDTKTNATVWTISFSGNNVHITNSSSKRIQYNSGSPRFKPYGGTQKDIQLFGKAVVVTETINISDLGYTEGEAIIASGEGITLTIDEPTNAQSITAQNGATVEVNQPTTAESVVVEDGSKIVAHAATTTPTVYFSTTMGVTDNNGDFHGVATELDEVTNITLATGGEIIYDLTLGTSMAGVPADPNQWHAFSLPFAVDALNGIYDAETGAKLQNEVNYAIMDYHGDIRANGQYGWKKYRGILQPGVFYLMTVDGNTKTFRFKASVTGAMSETNSMSAKAYDGTGEDSDKGWNGFGNPRWIGGTFAYNAQYLDPYTYEYVTITPGMTIPVGLPFFYKASTPSVVAMDEVGTIYAPARNKAYEIKNVAVRFGNEVSKDKLYISASEDALNEYEQDKDLVKMFMSQTPKVARISGKAYGMKLCMVNAPMVNDQAEYSLTLYAPQAGEYTISAPAMDNANLYLTLNGAIIWNLSMGEYTSDFAKGNNEGYGLLLVKKAPQVTTGVENAEANETGVQKVILNEHVYILRAEQMYDVTGKLVK